MQPLIYPTTILTSRSGIIVKVYHRPECNYVYCKLQRRTIRKGYVNKEKALRHAQEIIEDLDYGYDPTTLLDSDERAIYRMALAKLNGVPLLEAVDFYVKAKSARNAMTVESLSKEILAEQRRTGTTKERQYRLNRTYRKLFAYHSGPIHEITTEKLEGFLTHIKCPPGMRDHYRQDLRLMWNHAKRRGAVPLDRPLATDGLVRAVKAPTDPVIADPATMLDYLRAAQTHCPRIVPTLVIAMFCGVRTAELARMKWANLLPSGYIELSSAVTKTRKRRMVPIPPNAAAWLARYRKPDNHLVMPRAYPTVFTRFLEKAKLPRPPRNVFRHTAATMLLAKGEPASQVAAWLGNSPDVLEAHYKGLATPEEAAEYFSLTP